MLKSKIFIEQETLCDNAVRDCAFDIYVVNNWEIYLDAVVQLDTLYLAPRKVFVSQCTII